MILCDDGDDDGCGCVEPLFIFSVQMMELMMVGLVVGSVSDPMTDDLFGCGVGWVDKNHEMEYDEAGVQLIIFAWNATMLQAKTLNHSK